MQYQTFRGADVQEALFNVREALGADALIESTRHVQAGAKGRLMVEIVAAPSLAPAAPNRELGVRTSAAAIARASRLAERARAQQAARARAQGPSEELGETALGREIAQLRLMLDELSQGRPPRDRTRALLHAAGFEGQLARTLGSGAARGVKGNGRELRHWLRERVGQKLSCRSGLVEAP